MPRAALVLLSLTAAVSALALEAGMRASIAFGGGQFTFARGEDDETALCHEGKNICRNHFVTFGQTVKVDDIDVALFVNKDGYDAAASQLGNKPR